MSDLKFNCPHCNQSLEAPPEMTGQTIDCPSCSGSIRVPDTQPGLKSPIPPPGASAVSPSVPAPVQPQQPSMKEESSPVRPAPAEMKTTKKQNRQAVGCGCFLIIGIIAVIVIYFWAAAGGRLEGSVLFTGTQFIITNNDSCDWTNVELEVNNGYSLHVEKIPAGTTSTVGAMQFSNSKGERFNPYTLKLKSFVITCSTPKNSLLNSVLQVSWDK